MLLLGALFCATPLMVTEAAVAINSERPVYRTITRTYHNDNYYTKGLLASEKMEANNDFVSE